MGAKLEDAVPSREMCPAVNHLSWTPHIDAITSRAYSKIAFLQRNISHCPRQTKVLANQSLIRPKLEYSVSVWDPHTKKDAARVDGVQRNSARFVTGDFGREREQCHHHA